MEIGDRVELSGLERRRQSGRVSRIERDREPKAPSFPATNLRSLTVLFEACWSQISLTPPPSERHPSEAAVAAG